MSDKKKKQNKDKKKKQTSDLTPAEIIAAAKNAAFKDETPAIAFAHFRPLAESVPTENLVIFTGQPLLMRANIRTALQALEPHLEKAVNALRTPSLQEIFELPSLAMALEFAVGRVPVAKLSNGEIERLLSEGAPWRELMLSYLEIVSHPLIGLLPRERVAAVRAGRGKLDQAQDFVALPGLFAEFASPLANKHPFPAEKLDLLATLGGALVQNVKPGNTPTTVAKRSIESILRDQFAQLVVERYDQLLVMAALALGKRKADELLPALRAAVPRHAPPAEGVEEANQA
ncbi:MAG TPA: hypothetical protein PK156_50485 [Polyangium sp.]|nr:hypothetical protein [Polyangium sp.]